MSALVQLSPGLDRLAGVHLYPHQADGVAFLVSKRRAVLGDDMGLGKTRQAIAAMEMAAPGGAVLVVCPASLKLNWRREILLVDPAARIEVIGVDREPVPDARWVIVNYDLLARHADRLHAAAWAGVILDEAHFIKNASQRTSHVLKLLGVQDERKAAPIGPEFVVLLTGTPMTNRPKDLFNLLRCVGHPAARSFLGFARRYCAAYRNDWGWVTTGASNIDELNLLMKEVMLRRKKDEVLDLPPKIRSWVPVDLSDEAAALNAVESFLTWYGATDPARPNDTQFLARLTKVRVALHKAKHKAVAERIRDVVAGGEKVVVFTSFAEGVARHARTLGESCVSITGSDTAEQRMAAVDRFQSDPAVRVAVCNLIAGGVGLTLTAATHVIHLSRWWNPAVEEQCNDRVHRIGQTRPVTVHVPMAIHPQYREDSFDCLLQSLMGRKRRLASSALWPMGDTDGDVDALQKGLGREQRSSAEGDPLRSAVAAMFARDGLSPPVFEGDGSVRVGG
jgi:SWI/SNF-related matrix-associated actin-dependent regulator 1 of chromatin subfamily A